MKGISSNCKCLQSLEFLLTTADVEVADTTFDGPDYHWHLVNSFFNKHKTDTVIVLKSKKFLR